MLNSKLKLNRIQREYINDNYNINLDEPFFPAPGFATVTNIDLLMTAINYDRAHNYPNYPNEVDKQAAEKICNEIYEIAAYFKKSDGRSYVKGYDIEDMCNKAESLANQILRQPIGNDVFKIDQIINYLRSNRSQMEKEMAEILGIKFGEIMLQETLIQRDYDWIYSGSRNHPVIFKEHEDIIDPIGFVTKKLEYNSKYDDYLVALEDFYYNYK